jgi:hypothetical protein
LRFQSVHTGGDEERSDLLLARLQLMKRRDPGAGLLGDFVGSVFESALRFLGGREVQQC